MSMISPNCCIFHSYGKVNFDLCFFDVRPFSQEHSHGINQSLALFYSSSQTGKPFCCQVAAWKLDGREYAFILSVT